MKKDIERLVKNIKTNPHYALSVPAVLCFFTFITNLAASLQDGNIDSVELHQLLTTADGFETVILVVIMMVLNGKKK